jgi:ABC-type amino acid transport substrate-binding protein
MGSKIKDILKHTAPIWLLIALFVIFYPKAKAPEGFTPRDYDAIAASGTLRAVTEYDAISYHAHGDTVSGFHYALLHAFARSKGLQVEVTPVMSFGERLDGVLSGKYDLLAHSTPVTSELRDTLLFPHPAEQVGAGAAPQSGGRGRQPAAHPHPARPGRQDGVRAAGSAIPAPHP